MLALLQWPLAASACALATMVQAWLLVGDDILAALRRSLTALRLPRWLVVLLFGLALVVLLASSSLGHGWAATTLQLLRNQQTLISDCPRSRSPCWPWWSPCASFRLSA